MQESCINCAELVIRWSKSCQSTHPHHWGKCASSCWHPRARASRGQDWQTLAGPPSLSWSAEWCRQASPCPFPLRLSLPPGEGSGGNSAPLARHSDFCSCRGQHWVPPTTGGKLIGKHDWAVEMCRSIIFYIVILFSDIITLKILCVESLSEVKTSMPLFVPWHV